MRKLEKTAAFLFIIGLSKAGKIMELMDSDELKKVLNEFSKITELTPRVQQEVINEFSELGYQSDMNAQQVLYIIRTLFGGKINEQERKRLYLV